MIHMYRNITGGWFKRGTGWVLHKKGGDTKLPDDIKAIVAHDWLDLCKQSHEKESITWRYCIAALDTTKRLLGNKGNELRSYERRLFIHKNGRFIKEFIKSKNCMKIASGDNTDCYSPTMPWHWPWRLNQFVEKDKNGNEQFTFSNKFSEEWNLGDWHDAIVDNSRNYYYDDENPTLSKYYWWDRSDTTPFKDKCIHSIDFWNNIKSILDEGHMDRPKGDKYNDYDSVIKSIIAMIKRGDRFHNTPQCNTKKKNWK